MTRNDWQDVLQRISVEFPRTPVPTELLSHDADPFGDIAQELKRRFYGKTWPEITLEDWINSASTEAIVAMMPAQSFKYYLPSLMIAAISNQQYLDRCLHGLVPQNAKRKPKSEWWSAYFSGFTEPQRALVREFLAKVVGSTSADSEDGYLARTALENIW